MRLSQSFGKTLREAPAEALLRAVPRRQRRRPRRAEAQAHEEHREHQPERVGAVADQQRQQVGADDLGGEDEEAGREGEEQQLFVDLDRAKAELLGVPVADVFQTMQSFFGSQVAGQFSQFSRVWWVVLQADADYRARPQDFDKVYVRAKSGVMVPLSTLITTHYVAAPKLVTRFNGFPAVKLTGNPAEGYSSGQALKAMEEVAAEVLSSDYSYAWAGQALQEKASGSTSSIAFVFGIIVVFLLLAAQFEKWTLPVAVVLTVPFAVFGALLLT